MAHFVMTGMLMHSAYAANSQTANPYDKHPKVPTFNLSSTDLKNGEQLGKAQMSGIFGAGGQDLSPQLSWSGFPPTTKSFVITIIDPDATKANGFAHWLVVDIPARFSNFPSGAGALNSKNLPKEAIQLPSDGGRPQFVGAAPPPGSGKHHYFITVFALDVPSLGISKTANVAELNVRLASRTLARASIMGWAERR
jgi:Raf kinase inhibitor-like YbhB/YbcL family protein